MTILPSLPALSLGFSSALSPALRLALMTYLLIVASPGPSNLVICATAMERGRKPALQLALGVVSGSLFWGMLATLGVAAWLQKNAQLFNLLKIGGGIYLIWLATQSLRAVLRPGATRLPAPDRHFFWRGLRLHLSNPKAILAWLAISALAAPEHPDAQPGWSLLACCMSIALSVFAGYALLFSMAAARTYYTRVQGLLHAMLAAVYLAAGWALLFN